MEFGHWPILDRLLREAEGVEGFTSNTRAQAALLHALSNPEHGYWLMPPEHQQHLLSRVMALVPRIGTAPMPRETLEAVFRLWLTTEPFEAISRAVKVVGFTPRSPLPEEDLYPSDGFVGWFMKWARECDVPVAFMFWAGLAAIGSACRYNFFIDRGTELMRLQPYLIFVGEKATGKSTGLDACLEVLRHVNGLVWGWQPGEALPPLRKVHPYHINFLPEDTNQETLMRVLAPKSIPLATFIREKHSGMQDPHITESTGLLALDELTTFFGKDNWAADKRVPFLVRIFADKPYTYHTQKGGSITLAENAVGLFGCCPPDVMQNSVSPLLFQGGFLDRVMVVYRDPLPDHERRFPTARPRDPVVASQLARFLRPLTARLNREELVATREANDWFESWYMAQQEPEDRREHSVKRKANHMWKVAAWLSLSDESAPHIHARHFITAARVLNHEWFHYRRLLGHMEESNETQLMGYIERLLWRAGAVEGKTPGYMMKSELYSLMRAKKGLSPPTVRATPLLQSLLAAERIYLLQGAKSPKSRGHKTGEAYQLSREAAEDFTEQSPSVLRVLTAPHPPSDPHPDETAAPEPEALHTAPVPVLGQGEG